MTPYTDPDGTLHEEFTAYLALRNPQTGVWSSFARFKFDAGEQPKLGYRRTGMGYFCPGCGDVWASLALIDSSETKSRFEVCRVACEDHYDNYDTPGSLLGGGMEGLLPLLPREALKRELMIHLKHLDKEIMK